MLFVYLLLILIVTAVSLTVILWAGTYFFQGYIYTEPSPGLFWQAPAAAALLSIGYTIWVFAVALNSSATPQNIPIDTIFRFSPKEDMAELEGRPAKKIWAVKLDRKKAGDDKDGERVAYVVTRGDRGAFIYRDTTSARRVWQRQDVIAIELEKPSDGSKMRFDLVPTEEGNYREFTTRDGWVIHEYESGPSGLPEKFRWGKWFINLSFNIIHFVGWFIALWVILRFQWAHALGFAIVMWGAVTLVMLPMVLGYAGYVASSSAQPKTVAALFLPLAA